MRSLRWAPACVRLNQIVQYDGLFLRHWEWCSIMGVGVRVGVRVRVRVRVEVSVSAP